MKNRIKILALMMAAAFMLVNSGAAKNTEMDERSRSTKSETKRSEDKKPQESVQRSTAMVGEQINWQVMSSSGTDGASTNYQLAGTVCQTAVVTGVSTGFDVSSGFWQGGGGCCIPPIRGNVDYDPGDVIDISDLVYLVDYMFTGGPVPPCEAEADMNGDGEIDISDLVYLVDYMFTGGPEPAACGSGPVYSSPKPGDDNKVLIEYSYSGEVTIITVNSTIDLRGVQLELVNRTVGTPEKLAGDHLDMVSGRDGDRVKIGLLDLNGGEIIRAGSRRLIRLRGECEIVSAKVADTKARPLAPIIARVSKPVELPEQYSLSQNYPNPFNPATKIAFALPRAGHVSLDIYNVLGQLVTTLVDERLEAGTHQRMWNAARFASGVYLYRLHSEEFVKTKKMMLLK